MFPQVRGLGAGGYGERRWRSSTTTEQVAGKRGVADGRPGHPLGLIERGVDQPRAVAAAPEAVREAHPGESRDVDGVAASHVASRPRDREGSRREGPAAGRPETEHKAAEVDPVPQAELPDAPVRPELVVPVTADPRHRGKSGVIVIARSRGDQTARLLTLG